MSLRLDTFALGRELERFPGTLLGVCALLVLASLVALRSAGLTPDGGSSGHATAQAGYAAFGLLGLLAVSQAPPGWIGRRWGLFYGVGLLALALVLALGTKVNGARSWFSIGPLRLQPSEFVKYAVIAALARVVARMGTERLRTWRGLGEASLVVAAPVGLVLLQPDLGTALTFAPILLSIVVVAGARWRHLLAVALAGAAFVPFAWLFLLRDYQRLRILSFADSSGSHALGGGYQVAQSIIAVGSGGLWGRGWMQGTQGPLGFLPERHTDFIFAVVCEDFGLVGGALLLGLYGYLMAALVDIAQRARDLEGRLVVTGVAAVTLTQVVVNVGMVLGVLPVTGLPLPLVSYCGSSLVATLAGFGLAASVARHRARLG